MQKKVLNNKIGIQITLLLFGIALINIGICCMVLNFIDFEVRFEGRMSGYYGGSIYGNATGYGYDSGMNYFGLCMLIAGVILVIVSSINMANYVLIKKSLTNQHPDQIAVAPTKQNYTPTKGGNSLEDVANKIAYLQQMKSDGYISEAEYEDMKSNVLKNVGGLL